jgi:tripartite-type tricarboxylate transporter receptor subunit TctC
LICLAWQEKRVLKSIKFYEEIMFNRRKIITTALLTPFIAKAQTSWQPTKVMRVMVPYPAGGPTDGLGRMVAQELQLALNNPVIVENVAGASGAIGTRQIARAEPDGHSLIVGNLQTHLTNQYLVKDLGYDVLNDFTPIAGMVDLQQVLVVKNEMPVKTAQEFVQYALKEGDKLNYGSTGIGSGSHLSMELLKTVTGIKATHIPFRGAAPLAQEIMAGRIDCSVATLSGVLGQIQAGTMRCLGVASANRAPQLPTVQTLNELGIKGVEADSWLALFAPAKIPTSAQNRLAEIVISMLNKPEFKEKAIAAGFVVNTYTPEKFKPYHEAELKKWGEVIKSANIKSE